MSTRIVVHALQAIAGTNTGLERRPKKAAIHLKARELLPIATTKVPSVKVHTALTTSHTRTWSGCYRSSLARACSCIGALGVHAAAWRNRCPHPSQLSLQVDSSKFVQRQGTRLVLNGQTFKFAGASNYYMLTRAVEKVTRPQVLVA